MLIPTIIFTQSYANGPLIALADGQDGEMVFINILGPRPSQRDTYLSLRIIFVDVLFAAGPVP